MRMDDDAVAELLVRFLLSCRDACCSIEGLKEFYARNHPDAKSIILRRGIEEFCLIHGAQVRLRVF